MRTLLRAVATAALPLTIAQPATALEIDDSAMRAWIIDNPEVIADALERHRNQTMEEQALRQQERALERLPDMLTDAPFLGSADATVDVVMFSDYRCPHCRNQHAQIQRLLEEDPDIKVTIREMPILGESSDLAARYALAVNEVAGQAAYQAVHDRMFDARGDIDTNWITMDMAGNELTSAAVSEEMMGEPVVAHLQTTAGIAREIEILGTPFLIIGDTVIPGGLDLASMKHLIARHRALR